jgi:hypothetical protein
MNALYGVARTALSLLPSAVPRRQRSLAGGHALVDGIAFEMPVNSEDTPALMAAFPIDADAARDLLPGKELHPVRLLGGKGLLVVTVINYVTTDIGRYIEFSLAIACTHGLRPAPPLLPGLLLGHYGTGQYVVDLPVSSEISVKGGKGIWGMPKHQANLDFEVTDEIVSSQYDVDGVLGCRIEIDRPEPTQLPLRLGAVNYCAFRGLLMKSSVYFDGAVDVAFGRRAGARLVLGDAPGVAPLRHLDVGASPLFTAFLPSTRGVLDDHFESWFVVTDQPAPSAGEPLTSVVGLGLSQDWLAPPAIRVSEPVPAEVESRGP